MEIKDYSTELIESNILDEELVIARFKKPDGFNHEPGQFVMIGPESDPKIKKSYSIASPPSDPYIELCIRVHEGGQFSPLMKTAKPGDKFLIKGPLGKFILHLPIQKPTLFIAAGTGIAPIICMVKAALKKGTDQQIRLAYGFRNEDKYTYKEEIESLEKEHDNFECKPIISRPEKDYKGDKGHVQDLIKKYFNEGKGWEAYMCGPPVMVNEVFEMLKERGYDPHREMW